MKPLATCLLFLCLAAAPLFAQVYFEPTVRETETFFRKHVPEAMPLFEKIMEEEGRKAYRRAMQEAALEVGEYYFLADEDAAMGKNLLEQIRAGYQIDLLLLTFHEEKDEAKRTTIREKIIAKSKELATLEIKSLEHELVVMKNIVSDLEHEIEQSRAMSDSNYAEHVDALLQGRPIPGDVDPRAAAIQKALPEGWHTDFAAAKLSAKKTGKPILILFAAAWCAPCRELAKDVLPDPAVVKSINDQVTPLYVESDEHPEILVEYDVNTVPTFLLLGKKQNVKAQKVGFVSPEGLSKWLNKSVARAFQK